MSKILIVDDNEHILKILEVFLAMGNNNEVDTTMSAEHALELLDKKDYDLVIVDIRLIGMNGVELSLRIRKLKPHIKIIGLTGYYSELFTNYDYKIAGFDVVFEKPTGYRDFVSLLKNEGFIK